MTFVSAPSGGHNRVLDDHSDLYMAAMGLSVPDRLSQLQEGEEDIDTVIDETIAELLLQHEEE